jgi:D-alanine-D-alanine ligase
MQKLRVGVIFGGRSGEHEVSVASAASIFKYLDPARYEAVPVKIEQDGRWTLPDQAPTALSAADVIEHARAHATKSIGGGRDTLMPPHPGADTLVTIDRAGPLDAACGTPVVSGSRLDVVFPVLHGPLGEDGTVQGLLELANVPYVGCGVLASAVGMDKVVMKAQFEAHGLLVPPWRSLVAHDWRTRRNAIVERIRTLGFPVFVKPANLGSSVGISKVKAEGALAAAVEEALTFDRKVIVEAAVPDPREIECAVLGNDEPQASIAGEIVPSREFYDYEAKYLDEASRTIIPADLTPVQLAEVQRVAIAAFKAIDGSGLARVDFLLARESGAIYLNEINTLPGFTTISMFAKLWEATGIGYGALLDRLIALALERHHAKQHLKTSMFSGADDAAG